MLGLTLRGLVVGALVAVMSGCGAPAVSCYPVQGKVTVQGKPAAGAVVIFHPQGAAEDLQKLRPYATVDAQGDFKLNCLLPGDGAPAGDYKVTIVWEVAPTTSNDPEAATSVADRLKGKYKDPQTSGLTASISAAPNQLPPFAL